VLATHGYLMFDGEGVYLCSADDANPLSVDGARIARDWTRVAVPCSLLLGRTRATIRSAALATPVAPPAEAYTQEHGDYAPDALTDPQGAPAARRPDYTIPDAPTPVAGIPALQQVLSARDRTDAARPRITAPTDDESTRVEADVLARPPVRVASGDDESTRLTADPGRASSPALEGMGPPGAYAPMAPGAYPPPQGAAAYPATVIQPGFAPSGPTQPAFRPLPSQVSTTVGPLHVPAPTTRPAKPPRKLPPVIASALAALRDGLAPDSPQRKPILIVGCFLVFVFVITTVTLIRIHVASTAAAANAASTGTPTTPTPPPAQGTSTVATAPTTAAAGILVYPAPPPRPDVDPIPDAGAHPKKGKAPDPPPTLERTAVDAMNRGDLVTALGIYRKLSARDPDNVAFANAVRVLTQRAGAGGAAP